MLEQMAKAQIKRTSEGDQIDAQVKTATEKAKDSFWSFLYGDSKK